MSTTAMTKQQLSLTLRALTAAKPFDQITVVALCARSGISRKTFYYHFKDKYDLLTWLFEREVMRLIMRAEPPKYWDFYEILARYLFENRSFYCNVLAGRDRVYLLRILQDFMRRHFSRYLRLESLKNPTPEHRNECLDFLSVTFVASLEEWLLRRPYLPPEEYLALSRFDKLVDR